MQRLAEDRLADRTARLSEGVDRPSRWDIAGGEMDFRHATVVAGQETEQHLSEVETGRAVEPAHDAEIDDDDRARGFDEHVSGMDIGMKEAVAEHLVKKRPGGLDRQIFDPVPGGRQRRAVVDPNPGDPFQCQHAAAGARPIDPRHAKIRVPGEILGELRGRGCLEAQVHLEPHHVGQYLHDLDRFQPAQHGLKTLAQ